MLRVGNNVEDFAQEFNHLKLDTCKENKLIFGYFKKFVVDKEISLKFAIVDWITTGFLKLRFVKLSRNIVPLYLNFIARAVYFLTLITFFLPLNITFNVQELNTS